jgi:hypothetical protein
MRSGTAAKAARRLVVGVAAVLAACHVAATTAVAQTYSPEVDQYCRDDYFRHCSSYQLGTTALRRCMESKGRSLSPNCRKALRDAGLVRSGRSRN